MILKKITPENIDSLNWFDTIYISKKTIKNTNETLKKLQIQPFFEVKNNLDLLFGNYYFCNALNYSYSSDVE
jgi:hypothetical protein